MAKIWMFTKQNFDVLLTIVGAVAVAILGLLNIIQAEIVAAATLMILSLIGVSLLLNRVTAHHLQVTIEQALEHMRKPGAEQILTTYFEHMPDIDRRLGVSHEVWILSRTCSRIWQDFNDEFKRLLSDNTGTLRLMMVDPEDGAVKMIVNSAEWDDSNNVDLWQRNSRDFLARLAHFQNGRFQIRTIDYLPAWTLMLIDPLSASGVIYVELSTYQSNSRNRPTFVLEARRDEHLFQTFRGEFEAMWARARSTDNVPDARKAAQA